MPLGLGTGPLGGLFEGVSAHEAEDTVEAAWRLGVRFFDTAPLYGSGLAEERLGRALARRPREQYTLSTKVGRVLRPGPAPPEFRGAPPLQAVFDYSTDGIRRSLAASLERLLLDYVDLALLHDPEEHMEEARRAVETVRELAPRAGVGTNVVQTGISFVERGDADVVLLAGRWTLLDRSAADELLPLCAERGVDFVAAGVFNSGVLAGGAMFDYRVATPAVPRAEEEARGDLRPPRRPSRRCGDSVPAPASCRDLDPRGRPDAGGDLRGHPPPRLPRARRAVVGAPVDHVAVCGERTLAALSPEQGRAVYVSAAPATHRSPGTGLLCGPRGVLLAAGPTPRRP